MTCAEFDHLLDLYIDGELNETQRTAVEGHVTQCEECAVKLKAAKELRDILSHMDDGIAVPLQAQAAWRKAVREEAKRGKIKAIYKAVGAVAAVCVLTFGITSMIQHKPGGLDNIQRVEADGVSEIAAFDGEAVARGVDMTRLTEYVERVLVADDVNQALAYLKDVATEYCAEIEREADSTQGMNVFLQVPSESAQDFISAVNGIAAEPDESEYVFDTSAVMVGVCVMIVGS